MTDKLREAAQQALEALEETLRTLDDENAKPGGAISDTIWYSEHETLFDYIAAQITVIREALAEQEPVQEPVAWMSNEDFNPIRIRIMSEAYDLADRGDSEGYNAIKVMCSDVQRMLLPQRKPWVGLTNEEVYSLANAHLGHQPVSYEVSGIYDFARAVETKLWEKNT